MGYGSLVSLVFHNLPSLYPSSFCRNDFSYFCILNWTPPWLSSVFSLVLSFCRDKYNWPEEIDVAGDIVAERCRRNYQRN